MPVTTPSGASAFASTGPCSTCSSRNAAGNGAPRATSARLPTQPTSSPRKATTDPRPVRSTASSPPTTPSAPVEAASLRHGVEVRSDPDVLPLARRARGGFRSSRPRPRARPRASSRPRAHVPRPRRGSGAGGSRQARRRSHTARPAARESSSRRSMSALAERPQQPPADERETAATTNASGHDPDDTVAANTTGAATPIAARTVCWTPIVAPLRSAPASSAAAVNESPFHAIVSPPARPRTGTRSHVGPPARTAVNSITPTIPRPARRSGTTRAPDSVGPAAASDAERPTQHLRPGEHQRSRLSGKAVLVDEEEDAEPEHRDLRIQEETAAERQPPEPAIPDRRRDGGRLDPIGNLAPTQDEDTDERTGRAQCGEEEKRGLGTAGVGDRGQRQRTDEATERDRRLPDSECEATLVCAEPVHDRPSARRVDRAARGTDEPERDDDLAVARRDRRGNETESAQPSKPTVSTSARRNGPRRAPTGRASGSFRPTRRRARRRSRRARGRAPRVAEER